MLSLPKPHIKILDQIHHYQLLNNGEVWRRKYTPVFDVVWNRGFKDARLVWDFKQGYDYPSYRGAYHFRDKYEDIMETFASIYSYYETHGIIGEPVQ